MGSLNEDIREYTAQLQKGSIQRAYKELWFSCLNSNRL